VEQAGGRCLPCVVDIRYEDQISRAVTEAIAKFGGIDAVVNNASAIDLSSTADVSDKKFHLMMDINAKGTFFW
jgi:citronellol/citronellal dehydrogenase